MLRLLIPAFLALTVALAGCPLMLAEQPLGSEPAVLEPAELNGFWVLRARVDGRYESGAEDMSPVIHLNVRDVREGKAGVWVVSLKASGAVEHIGEYEVLVRRHKRIMFASFRWSGLSAAGYDAATLIRARRFLVVERLSATEMRLRLMSVENAKKWAAQGRLPGRTLDYDPLSNGWVAETGGAEFVLGALTPEQLDAITAPEALAELFPLWPGQPTPKGGEVIMQKASWTPLPGKE